MLCPRFLVQGGGCPRFLEQGGGCSRFLVQGGGGVVRASLNREGVVCASLYMGLSALPCTGFFRASLYRGQDPGT